MDYKIIWSPRSLETLEHAVSSIRQHNPDAARKVGLTILRCAELLRTFPRLGCVWTKLNRDDVRELAVPPYRRFYQVKDATCEIVVLTVWHGNREEPELPNP